MKLLLNPRIDHELFHSWPRTLRPFLASFLDRYGDGDVDKQQVFPSSYQHLPMQHTCLYTFIICNLYEYAFIIHGFHRTTHGRAPQLKHSRVQCIIVHYDVTRRHATRYLERRQAKQKPLAAAIQEISDGEDVWSGAEAAARNPRTSHLGYHYLFVLPLIIH